MAAKKQANDEQSVCSWYDYVQVAKKLGFQRVTVINRYTFEVINKIGIAPNYPCQWQDGDTVINELEELNTNWMKKSKKIFCFYGGKYEIIDRDIYGGKWLQCQNENEYLCCFQFKEIWFIVYHKKSENAKEQIYKTPKEAFTKINKLLDPINSWIHML